jgi:integrase
MGELGHLRLSAVTRNHLQDIADGLVAEGRAPSTVRNTLLPLRAIYRRAVSREQVPVNPTLKLALPTVRGRRERIARPGEAASLIAAAPARDQAIWATAFYAGLRLGELRALGWHDVDLERGLIRVEHAWDAKTGLIEPKSRSGKRRVPLNSTLRGHLLAHRLRQGHAGEGLVFGETRTRPFHPGAVARRAAREWSKTGQARIRLHECRHTYAAFMIAAGVNVKALSTYMGHSSITITLDRYGHLLPGNEAEAATMLDAWLESASA